jgi:hypothetical protein
VSDCPPRFDCPYTSGINGTRFCRCHQFWGLEGAACDEVTGHTSAVAAVSALNALCFALALVLAQRTLRDRVREHGVYRCDRWGAVDTTMLCVVGCLLANLVWAAGWVATALLVDHGFAFDTTARPVVSAVAAITFVGALLNVSVMWLEVATDSVEQGLRRRQRARSIAQSRARSASAASLTAAAAAAAAAGRDAGLAKQQSTAAAQNLQRYRRHVLWATSVFGLVVVALLAMRKASMAAMLAALFAVLVMLTYRKSAAKLSAKMLGSAAGRPSASSASSARKGGASPRGAAANSPVGRCPPSPPMTQLERGAALIVQTSDRVVLAMAVYVLGTAMYVVGDRRDEPNAVTLVGTVLIVQMNLWAMLAVQQYAEHSHRLKKNASSKGGWAGGAGATAAAAAAAAAAAPSERSPPMLARGPLTDAVIREGAEKEVEVEMGSGRERTGSKPSGIQRGSIYDAGAVRTRAGSRASVVRGAAASARGSRSGSGSGVDGVGGGGVAGGSDGEECVSPTQEEDWIEVEVDGGEESVLVALKGSGVILAKVDTL